jgi:hypothetical protein
MAHTGSKAGVAPYFYAFCLSILGTAGSQLEDAGARQDIQSTVELALKMSLRQEKNGWGFVQMSNPIWNEISRPIVDPLLSLAATGLLTQGR